MTNEHEYVTKMAQNVTMGDLWEDFNAMFWITYIYKDQFMFGIKYQNA